MTSIAIHRSVRFTNDYPVLALLPGARVELYPDYTLECPHPDDEFAPAYDCGTVVETDVHTANPDFIWGYDIETDDGEMRYVKGVRRVLSYPQEH